MLKLLQFAFRLFFFIVIVYLNDIYKRYCSSLLMNEDVKNFTVFQSRLRQRIMHKLTVLQVFIFANLISQQSTELSSLLRRVDETSNSDFDLLSVNSMSAAINTVIHESFLVGGDTTTINIVSSAELSRDCRVTLMVRQIVESLSDDDVSFRVVGDFDGIDDNDEIQRFCNVIFVNDYESFASFPVRIQQGEFHSEGFYLFVILEKHENRYDDMQMMFVDLWEQFAVNSNVLVHGNSSDEIEMFTYFPYTSEHCGEVVPENINTFRASMFITKRFFENKMENLFKCPLRIVTFNIAPLMMAKVSKDGNYTLDGIEGKLLNGKKIA